MIRFAEALEQMLQGKKIGRASWQKEGGAALFIYLVPPDRPLYYGEKINASCGGVLSPWKVTNDDILADDWKVIDDGKPIPTL